MASNTTYDPQNSSQYVKNKLQANHRGVQTTVTAGLSANIDMTMGDDCLLTGIQIRCKGQKFGDTIDGQIVVIGAGPEGSDLVLLTFASDWGICEDPEDQVNEDSIYPAKLSTGMTIRIIYNSTGESNVNVIVNYKLQKVLT